MRNGRSKFLRTKIYAGIIGSSLLLADTLQAAGLEEVVVTARKRVESLQDVPISIVAVSGDKMARNMVLTIDELQIFTPNLSMTETGIGTQIFIRGIGTGTDQGFEQSVGSYVDGIYYGRSQLLRMPFLDLERIEVLRGPQSILFGKNSIAGALNMTTAKPTEEREGRVSVNYSPDGDIAEYIGVASGPLTETLSGRLVARQYNEDGWLDNLTKNNDEVNRDDAAARLNLRWQATEDLRADFKAEWNKFDAKGRQIEVVKDDPALSGSSQGLTFAQILAKFGYPDALTEVRQDNQRQANAEDKSDNKVQNYTLNVDYQLGDLTLTAISGYVHYDYDETFDPDFTGAPLFKGSGGEKFHQYSQEVRLVSPVGQTVDWIGGIYYQTSDQDYHDAVIFPADSILGAAIPAAVPVLGTEAARDYSADADLYAAFAQATWNINERWRLTGGGRYTYEDKSASREINILDSATGAVTTSPIAPVVWGAGLGMGNEQFTGHSVSGHNSENVFTPLVNVQWDVIPETMLYAAFSTGFKSGGFDARGNSPDSFEFDNEDATTYEIGAKNSLLDGRLEVNVALYYTEYDNLQTSQYDGNLGFTVGNAKKTEVQGVELDGRWALTDSLTLSYGLAYLDHEYKDFTNGNCYNRQVPDGDVVNGVALCDYTGKRGQFTPKYSGILSLYHVMDITSGLRLQSNFDVSYRDEQNTHVNLDPNWDVDSMTIMNVRTGVYADNWDIAVLVQNLSDEQQYSNVNNIPLSSTFGTNSFYSFITPPRTTYIQVSYHF